MCSSGNESTTCGANINNQFYTSSSAPAMELASSIEQTPSRSYKVILLGDFGVGKTTFVEHVQREMQSSVTDVKRADFTSSSQGEIPHERHSRGGIEKVEFTLFTTKCKTPLSLKVSTAYARQSLRVCCILVINKCAICTCVCTRVCEWCVRVMLCVLLFCVCCCVVCVVVLCV